MVEVHSLLDFNESDIPKGKPPDQCLDELGNFIMKQSHFNERIQGQLHDNSLAIKSLLDVLGRTVNDVKCLVKHFHMVQTQLEQISYVQKDLLANNAQQDNLLAYGIKTRCGTHTQDPLYPEGHPKRIEQDSQLQEEEIVSSPKKKKKKKHKEADKSNDPIEEEEQVVDPNSISTSDAETEDGAEPEKDAEKNDPLKLVIRGLNPQSSITLSLGVATNHLAKVKYGNGEHARITQELKYKREESNILLNKI